MSEHIPEKWLYLKAIKAARQTFERLQREGHPADTAKRLVNEVINAEQSAIYKQNRPFNETRFVERLQQLPATPPGHP